MVIDRNAAPVNNYRTRLGANGAGDSSVRLQLRPAVRVVGSADRVIQRATVLTAQASTTRIREVEQERRNWTYPEPEPLDQPDETVGREDHDKWLDRESIALRNVCHVVDEGKEQHEAD